MNDTPTFVGEPSGTGYENRARDVDDGGGAFLHIFVGCGPAGDADAHGGVALPLRSSTPARAFALDRGNDFASLIGSSERHEDLVENDVIEDRKSGVCEKLREEKCLAAIALDEFS